MQPPLADSIRDMEAGVLIAVLVQPRAKRTQIVGWQAGRLKLSVTQAPQDGKANQAVLELIADRMCVPKSNCSIRRGHAARQKSVFVTGLTRQEALNRLQLGSERPQTGKSQ